MKLLVIGGGGREHAIAWKAAKNPNVEIIYCAPGNGGTAIEDKCKNVNLNSKEDLLNFAKENLIDLTIVGPEAMLVEGIVDDFKSENLNIFGPSKAAAELEGSKSFAKDFMKKYGVKTADYEVFTDVSSAIEYLKTAKYPIVIKADGLAAGKGVVIPESFSEAEKNINEFMIEDKFKGSGKKIVIEEFLEGVEASILCITDGNTMIPFISAKDHKNIFDGNKGPNTGGMGVIAPNPYCSSEVLDKFQNKILNPTLNGIQKENMDYIGIVFFGLMITKEDVYLLEYNVRMGDPETQAVLPLMESDLVELILAATKKELSNFDLKWKDKYACCVVASSKGYPRKYEVGYEISIPNLQDTKIFAAGMSYENNNILTSGGRVFGLTALGNSIEEARNTAYRDIEKINFEGMYYRKDIGKIY